MGNPGGDAALQNALAAAAAALAPVPAYGAREVLVILSALATCDPGDIRTTVAEVKRLGIRASVVGLSAEVHICRVLAETTGGRYGMALNETQIGRAHV